ncbi:MAG: response regulator [Desulfobacterales bacterium]|nr:response regulator [Desulfobacterales bacterium]
MNILIIDAEEDTADSLAKMLQGWDHNVVRVSTDAEAIAKSKQSFFEVVLMELVLKGMPVYQIIPDLKLYNPGVSVITMTRENSPDLEKKARERGISFYTGKPVDRGLLKQILDQLTIFHLNSGDWKMVAPF